ncbi:hypothetical protein PIB30_079651 [Stylosanthes scabra]|uniref:Uncharacterized protein n=1 Tax=Stylosanthes scabra TaxID=79078 RepID=A0ABU6QRN9_9FABA|nr:hypothetical protein [Stylosanthes scabra]
MTGCITQFLYFFEIRWQCSSGTLAFTAYAFATDGSGSGSGSGVSCAAYPHPSTDTYNPAAELVGDPDEPYVAERVLHGAPEAYYSETSYGSEHESASTDSIPSSNHSSGSSSGSVSLGYGSASSGSASDGASDDDLVNHYFVGTFPPP